jgi:hypothetical protein
VARSSRKKQVDERKRDAKVQQIEDDRYMIKVGHLNGTYVARAFPKADGRSRGMLFEARGASADDAVGALRTRMETSAADDIAGRRKIETSGFQVPQAKEYASALRHLSLSQAQVVMLKAHAGSQLSGMTIRELAGAAGYSSLRSANATYGKIGMAIRDNLKLKASSGDAGLAVLAVEEPGSDDGAGIWIMHPELRAAVVSEL